MAKVIVTGGAGFIGSHLTDALVERGDEVTVIDNLSGGKREQINPRAIFCELDIIDQSALTKAMSGAEVVFHLAAWPSVPRSIEEPLATHEVNATGTLNVFRAAQLAGAKRVIYSSSSAVYGDQAETPLSERLSPKPQSPYGLQKLIGELYAKMFGELYALPVISLRYFNVYGPRQSQTGAYASVINRFIEQTQTGQPLTVTGDGRQTRDFVNVLDVVRANLLAGETKQPKANAVYNIGSGQGVSIKQLVELFGGPIEYLPPRLESRDSLADIRLAQTELGWRPTVELVAGIAELKALNGLN
ncbi:MAG: hypothetical protein COV08_02175 [Candidatus Vogelbacteria bacterium CG10_big_fil_rev_8_21_14_0_10_49_38]|uniref:NAD-dependent epimerase/dehydratase domain-containing protein n=1 Tax=Candidatus Vogelbacteria bacterium CG10_big_fil_rev_8_21_14_0_10_49_38 TaxID=1975043 RepID=A0A2H0RHK0_9BACT|nr:MAG: hypothetical protein BK006_02195 [bacterium CG10_49_38]PIR45973.1 MAG: hypothetical protein COV08_02175 [Candidatus Vogelbacteria bacterium CG10_big_fil_rev_8_21_14_0_10_49_38]